MVSIPFQSEGLNRSEDSIRGLNGGEDCIKVINLPRCRIQPHGSSTVCHVLILGDHLKHDYDINACFHAIGWIALMLTVLNNYREVVEQLLRHCANTKFKDVNSNDTAQLRKSLGHT